MENEKIIAVLSELLEDQRGTARSQAELMEMMRSMIVKLDDVAGRINDKEDKTPKMDLKAIQQMLDRGVAEIKLLIELLIKNRPSNNLRIFLESDAKKWAVYLLVSLTFLTYLYWFAVHRVC